MAEQHQSDAEKLALERCFVVAAVRASGLLTERSWVRFPVWALSGHLGQLSLPSPEVGKSSTSLHRLGLRRGARAYVWLQVKLCDTI